MSRLLRIIWSLFFLMIKCRGSWKDRAAKIGLWSLLWKLKCFTLILLSLVCRGKFIKNLSSLSLILFSFFFPLNPREFTAFKTRVYQLAGINNFTEVIHLRISSIQALFFFIIIEDLIEVPPIIQGSLNKSPSNNLFNRVHESFLLSTTLSTFIVASIWPNEKDLIVIWEVEFQRRVKPPLFPLLRTTKQLSNFNSLFNFANILVSHFVSDKKKNQQGISERPRVLQTSNVPAFVDISLIPSKQTIWSYRWIWGYCIL